jgi:hypothetical protein
MDNDEIRVRLRHIIADLGADPRIRPSTLTLEFESLQAQSADFALCHAVCGRLRAALVQAMPGLSAQMTAIVDIAGEAIPSHDRGE